MIVEKGGKVLRLKDKDALDIFLRAGYKEVKKDNNLENYTVNELRAMAAKQGIQGTGKMKKAELIEAIRGE